MDKFKKVLESDAVLINKKVKLDELLSKQLIITGASGLIGINLLMSIKKFCQKKDKAQLPKIIAIFHNDIPEYFKEILNFENLIIKKGDLTNPAFIDSLGKADYIIHAAGYGQPTRFMQDKIKTIAINTTATMSLLRKLKIGGRFLFISTSEVYSGLSSPSFKENQIGTTNTTHPRSCYIESKRCGEAICNAFRGQGINAKSARLSLAYGPGTRPGDTRVLNEFIYKALNGEIKLLDQGEAKRTYCYVADAIEIMWNILLFGKEPIYNIGGFSTTTIADLAKKIGALLNSRVIVPANNRKIIGAPDNVRLDMNKTARQFRKKKKDYIPLNLGLMKTIEWQKELYQII